jgi:hypothetical protein
MAVVEPVDDQRGRRQVSEPLDHRTRRTTRQVSPSRAREKRIKLPRWRVDGGDAEARVDMRHVAPVVLVVRHVLRMPVTLPDFLASTSTVGGRKTIHSVVVAEDVRELVAVSADLVDQVPEELAAVRALAAVGVVGAGVFEAVIGEL